MEFLLVCYLFQFLIIGLPPIYGLYASVVPPFVYALLGSSMQLNIGPVAVTAILTANAMNSLNLQPDPHITIKVFYRYIIIQT